MILSDSLDGGVVLDTNLGGDVVNVAFLGGSPDCIPVFGCFLPLFGLIKGTVSEFEEFSVFEAVRDVLLRRAFRYNDVDPTETSSDSGEELRILEVEVALEVLRVSRGGFFVAVAVITGSQVIEGTGVVIRVVVPRKGKGSGSHIAEIFMSAYKDWRREYLYTPVRGGGAEAAIKVRGGVSPPFPTRVKDEPFLLWSYRRRFVGVVCQVSNPA